MKNYTVKTILERLKSKLNARTDVELSKIFGVKPNTISTWKKRNTINYERLIEVCSNNKIKLDELLHGSDESKKEETKISYMYYTNTTR